MIFFRDFGGGEIGRSPYEAMFGRPLQFEQERDEEVSTYHVKREKMKNFCLLTENFKQFS